MNLPPLPPPENTFRPSTQPVIPTFNRGARVSVADSDVRERLALYGESMELTEEHAKAFKAIFQEHKNVFLTGGAGTGKSMMTHQMLIPELNHRGLNYAVTASTGIAGSHVGGRTLHSWAGIGLGVKMPEDAGAADLSRERIELLYKRTFHEWSNSTKNKGSRPGVIKRIQACEVLILDEVGMCPGVGLLDYLDFLFRELRGSERPFGGIQMIFVGDFLQLPPVEKVSASRSDWAFLGKAWCDAQVEFHELQKVYRQADVEFANFLNRRRFGIPMTAEEQVYADGLCRPLSQESAMKATYLVTTNKMADAVNKEFLSLYPGPVWRAQAEFTCDEQLLGPYDNVEEAKRTILRSSNLKETLELKPGLPVLICVNDPEGKFFNGTRAVVEKFEANENFMNEKLTLRLDSVDDSTGEDPLVTFNRKSYKRRSDDDKEEHGLPSFWQFPVIPASAITVHKSQGMSLDSCVIDLSNAFAPGHVYVAMSRLRTAKGLTLISSKFDLRSDPHAVRYYDSNRK